MVRRKEVRFSAENSFSDVDLGSSLASESRQSTPTKPILVVKRGSSGSPTSSSSQLSGAPYSKKPLHQVTQTPAAGKRDFRKNVTKSEPVRVEADTRDVGVEVEEVADVDQVTVVEQIEELPVARPVVSRTNRCRSAPSSGRQYHWDSSTKQWFSNKSLTHRDSDKPIQVRVFKYNVNQPKVDRWISDKSETLSSEPPSSNSPQTYNFKCSNTVELVNSLQKPATRESSGEYPTSQYLGNPSNYARGSAYDTPPSSPVVESVIEPLQTSHTALRGSYPNITPPTLTTPQTFAPQTLYAPQTLPAPQTVPSPHPNTEPQHRGTAYTSLTMQNTGVAHLGQRVSRDMEVGPKLSLGSIYPPDQMSKSQAKAELQGISSRLGNYIQYVREISENANQVDLASFVNSIKILEEELVNIKNLYEGELGTARQDVDDLSRTKNQFQQEVQKLQTQVVELENRLTTEVDKNRQAVNEINTLQRTVMQRDRDLTETKLAMQKPIGDLDLLSKEFHCVLREKEDVKRRWEHETLQRQEAEGQNTQLHRKIDIDTKVHDEEAKDLNDRLNAASNTILTLESKIREMTHADTALAEMLQRVRDVAEAEIERYRQESEARFSQNVSELQSQLNECNRKIADLNERNQQLHMEIGDYQSNTRTLQGQVTSLEHQKGVLEEDLMADRQRSHDHIKLLEHKLVQLQDNIITKMRELNAARDAQIPLKAEIETLRSMMEEEEQRLKLPPTPRLDIPDAPSYSSSRVPATSTIRQAYTSSTHNPNTISNYSNTHESPRPLGPVRVRSAPAMKQSYVPTSLGQGKDYFDEMFNDLKVRELRENLGISNMVPKPPSGDQNSPTNTPERGSDDGYDAEDKPRPMSSSQRNYTYNTSATGDIKILEVQPDGEYIRLINSALTKEAEIGGHMIQQNVGGHPVAVYRFPPRVSLPAGQTVTVWGACADQSVHKPPSDYYFKEQEKWGTGPECTTIVCKPDGQAVSWTTATHRVTQDLYNEAGSEAGNLPDSAKEELTVYNMDVNAAPKEPVYLRREKEQQPCLHPPKHPHGVSTPSVVHPHTGQPRALAYGNDNSSVNRQSRVQSTRPDPIPGAPYAGASAQRMGSASLRKYQGPTIKGSGAIANKSAGTIRYGPPTPFLSSLQQDYTRRQATGATVVQIS